MRTFNLTSIVLLAAAFSAQNVAFAQSTNNTKQGKGLQFIAADSSFSVKLNGRIQSLYSGTYETDSKSYQDQFQIRRARLKFEGFAYNPKLTYKLEIGLSNSDIGNVVPESNNTANVIFDAFANWNAAKGLNILFGQTKLPGNRERVISSQKMQFVDRSLLNARFNIDRDMGVQVHYQFELGKTLLRQLAAVTMGEGRNITAGNRGGYDFTGRAEFLPFGEFEGEGDYFGSDLKREKTPKLSLGVTYDFNERASRQGGQLGEFFDQQRDLKTIFADAMFKYNGFSAMAEYADKRTNGSPVVEADLTGDVTEAFYTGTGFNIQAGYLFKNNFELAGRYTTINPEAVTQRANHTQYTLGVSKYLAGHTVKVQSDVSLMNTDLSSDELMYRFQVEIGF